MSRENVFVTSVPISDRKGPQKEQDGDSHAVDTARSVAFIYTYFYPPTFANSGSKMNLDRLGWSTLLVLACITSALGRWIDAKEAPPEDTLDEGKVPDSFLPKIVHITERAGKPAPYLALWLEKNPGWRVEVWTDDRIRDRIAAIGDDAAMTTINRFHGAKLADYFRLFVLEVEGGVYADADVEPLQSLEEYFEGKPAGFYLVEEPDLHKVAIYGAELKQRMACNFFLASAKGDPSARFLRKILEALSPSELARGDATSITGPMFVQTHAEQLPTLMWLPSQLFSSFVAPYSKRSVEGCKGWRIKGALRRKELLRTCCSHAKEPPLLGEFDESVCSDQEMSRSLPFIKHHWSNTWQGDKWR